jgi:hypothetical protein
MAGSGYLDSSITGTFDSASLAKESGGHLEETADHCHNIDTHTEETADHCHNIDTHTEESADHLHSIDEHAIETADHAHSIDGKLPATLGQTAYSAALCVVPPADAAVVSINDGALVADITNGTWVDKRGRNNVAVSFVTTSGGGAPDHVGMLKVQVANLADKSDAFTLALPTYNILTGAVITDGFEFTCNHNYVRCWYDMTSGGTDDTIDVNIAVS